MKYSQREVEEARASLLEDLKPGDTVYTVIRNVSRSGMSRSIDLYKLTKDGPLYLTYAASRVLGDTIDQNNGGIKIGGCGMDMGFALVYNLSALLFADGHKCLGKKCPSNDHSNDYNEFSESYDEEHAPEEDRWWLNHTGFYEIEGLTQEQRNQQRAYQEAKRIAWNATEKQRYSKRRVHHDGGYALNQRWL